MAIVSQVLSDGLSIQKVLDTLDATRQLLVEASDDCDCDPTDEEDVHTARDSVERALSAVVALKLDIEIHCRRNGVAFQ